MERLLSSCEYLSIYASSDVSASKYYSIDGNVMVYSPDLGLPLTYNSFQLKMMQDLKELYTRLLSFWEGSGDGPLNYLNFCMDKLRLRNGKKSIVSEKGFLSLRRVKFHK